MKIKRNLILVVFFIIILFSTRVFASDEVDIKDNISAYPIVIVVISVVFLVIGKMNNEGSIQFEEDEIYYPPNGESPILLEYILKEKITKKGIISSLLYLANKGYIRFEEYYEVLDDFNDERLQKSIKKMKIIKIKDYNEKDKINKLFFNTLFSISDQIELDELQGRNRINHSVEKLYNKITDIKNKAIIYKKGTEKKIIKIYVMIFIILTLIIINTVGIDNVPGCIVLIVGLVPLLLCLRLFNSIIIGEDFIKEEERILLFVLICFLMIILFWGYFAVVNNAIKDNSFSKICYLISIICVIILDSFIITYPRKKEIIQKMANSIKNYKNTLKDVDEKKIENLIRCNQKYFYITLSYAYMLDIEKIFIEKYGVFVNDKPKWFISEEEYNIYEINIIILNKIEDLISSI